MQSKALVAFATVLIMVLAVFPIGVAVSEPEGSEFSTGWYWESNELSNSKLKEIYGDTGIEELGADILNSMFIDNYNSWNVTMEDGSKVKESDAFCYSVFPYDDGKGYYEMETRYAYGLSGHIKATFTPDKLIYGESLFNLEYAVNIEGELKDAIKSAKVTSETKIVFEGDLSFARTGYVDATYILNNNGSYLCNSYGENYMYYLGFENAKITYTDASNTYVLTASLEDESDYEYIESYYSVNDPTEEGMKKIKVGEEVESLKISHNTWDNWHGAVKFNGKTTVVSSDVDTNQASSASGPLTSSGFASASELKSLSAIYGGWYYGKGGDVTATENFLKSNGHFEKGYECGKFNVEVIMNELQQDKKYSDYVKDQFKSGSSSNNNTLLYAVSAIAVVLLIALIALAVMYNKKTA